MTTSAVGLDIGSTAVRAVQLSSPRKTMPVIMRSQEVPLPPGAVVRGEVLDAEVVSNALKKLWAQAGFKSKKVILGVGNESVLVRELTVPKASLKDIQESLPFHVQDIPHAPFADSLLDFYPLSDFVGEHGSVINGLLIVADKKGVIENIKVAERAGLLPIALELTPFALNRVLIARPALMGTVALIDIGGTTTSITISNDGEPAFVRMISAGGQDVTQALHKELKIDIGEAEMRKRTLTLHRNEVQEREDDDLVAQATKCECPKCLVSVEEFLDPRPNEILRAVTGELLAGLLSTITYFNNSRPLKPVSQIILTGGGSRLNGFSVALSQVTHLPVKYVDPFATFTVSHRKSAKNFQLDVAMSVALGLALRCTP
jgi:type IV pilus assembly protein PilM